MVEYTAPRLDAVFHALADPTRREMLRGLSRAPHTVTELAAPFRMSLAAASKHIKVLERAGLVRREVQGRTHLCRLAPGPLAEVQAWVSYYERFWHEQLDALGALLEEDDRAAASSTAKRKGRS